MSALKVKPFSVAGIGHRGDAAAARTGHRVEVDIVLHPAVFVVLERHLDGVADPHPHEGSRHLAVEGPVAVGGAVGEIGDALDRVELDADDLRVAACDRCREVGRRHDDRRRHRLVDGVGKRCIARRGLAVEEQSEAAEGRAGGGDHRRRSGHQAEPAGQSPVVPVSEVSHRILHRLLRMSTMWI